MESSKKLRAQKTRCEILHAAVRLFAIHGYHHTATAEILQSLSLSKGAFYYHFKSKEELACQTLDFASRQITQQLTAAPGSDASDSRALALLCRRLLSLHDTPQWDYLLLIARLSIEFAESGEPLLQAVNEKIASLTCLFRQAIEQDQTALAIAPDLDSQNTAVLFTSMLCAAAIPTLCPGRREFAHLLELLQKLLYRN